MPSLRVSLAVLASFCIVTSISSSLAAADDNRESIEKALATTVLEPGLTLAEIKAFVEPRIVQPPRAVDLSQWERTSAQLRRRVLNEIVYRGRAIDWRDAETKVDWLDTIEGGPGYQIRKLRYEALPGMWIPALLYQPEKLSGRVPFALHVNGHDPKGKATDYKQLRSINLAKRGMLVLDIEWFGMGQLRTSGFAHGRMNQLELCGASGLAPFYLAMRRAIDLGISLENVDSRRVVVSGLSGGGWQTILISSLDQRVTLANPVAGFGSFHTNIAYGDMGDSEQAPSDLATIADYTHLTALRAPRPTLLTYNAKDDCCFQSGHTLEPLLNAAGPVFSLFGGLHDLRSHVNHVPGTHNFEQENREQLYSFIGDYFFSGDHNYPSEEISSTDELKTAEQLQVELPASNLDFHRLAQKLATTLPRSAELPTDKSAAQQWQTKRRQRLIELLRIPQYEVTSSKGESLGIDNLAAESLRLKVGGHWTIPATRFTPSDNHHNLVLLIADQGRAAMAAEASNLLAKGNQVIAIDPLLWGESMVKAQDPDYVYPLFISAVGQRPLGIQAAQLTAIARWAKAGGSLPVKLVAIGPRASTAALTAAAIETRAIDSLELSDSLATFHELLERDLAVESMPELFPFGLLTEFDISQLVALATPTKVIFRNPSDRARSELASLASWYTLFDVTFDPTR